MRALRELGTVIVAGLVAFFSGLLLIGAVLILWFLGLVSALMLMISAFAGVTYLITGKAHDAHLAVVYLGYAAAPFVASFVFHVYRGRWADGWQRRRELASLGRLPLPQDARFNEAGALPQVQRRSVRHETAQKEQHPSVLRVKTAKSIRAARGSQVL